MPARFEFGKNWTRFVKKHFSKEALAAAQKGMCSFLLPPGVPPSLKGLHFLDIGCGSGLHSLAALRAGADRVVSFDFDPDSVRAAQALRRQAGSPSNWTILQGDVLDETFIRSLGTFDVVYSWGCLHHTGNMTAALANALLPVGENGLFFVALYSYTAYQNGIASGQPSPEEWLDIKRRYCGSGIITRRLMTLWYLWRRYFKPAGADPRKIAHGARELHERIKQYGEQSRGMNFFTDIHDWLGGWPMEFVHEADLLRKMDEEWGMELLRMETGRGNTEFLFRPKAAKNIWDGALTRREARRLEGPFIRYAGHVWLAALPEDAGRPDTEKTRDSRLQLLEDGRPLPFGHSPLPGLLRFGAGRYRHTKNGILFSAGDNSDPNRNGKAYSWFLDRL